MSYPVHQSGQAELPSPVQPTNDETERPEGVSTACCYVPQLEKNFGKQFATLIEKRLNDAVESANRLGNVVFGSLKAAFQGVNSAARFKEEFADKGQFQSLLRHLKDLEAIDDGTVGTDEVLEAQASVLESAAKSHNAKNKLLHIAAGAGIAGLVGGLIGTALVLLPLPVTIGILLAGALGGVKVVPALLGPVFKRLSDRMTNRAVNESTLSGLQVLREEIAKLRSQSETKP